MSRAILGPQVQGSKIRKLSNVVPEILFRENRARPRAIAAEDS
jgi:hypothetical protein